MASDLPRDVSRCAGAVEPGGAEPMLCEPCKICRRRTSLAAADDGLYWFAVPPAVQYHGQWVCGSFIETSPSTTLGADA